MHLITTWAHPLPSCMLGMHASYYHMGIPTTIMYIGHACILSPHGHTRYHHVCKACMPLITTWAHPLPSCMLGMHASYYHMGIPTTIMYMGHACILSPHGHIHYHHVCKACVPLITYHPSIFISLHMSCALL